jgi:hypothetical protein
MFNQRVGTSSRYQISGVCYMTEEEQLIEWERQEEQYEFAEACWVANSGAWVDDGS